MLGCATALSAAEPVAIWQDFRELTDSSSLAPQISSTQNGVNGSGWRLTLGGGSVTDGVLSTGTGTAPTVSFNSTINVGYNSKPLTVVLAIEAPLAATVNKPLAHFGNGSAGIGMALATLDTSAQTATLCGSWGNSEWKPTEVTVADNALAGTGIVYVAFSTYLSTASNASIGVIDTSAGTVSWNTLSGLRGNNINATSLYLGNFGGVTSGGLDFKVYGLAVFAERPETEDVLAVTKRLAVDKQEISGNEAWLFEDVEDTYEARVKVTAASSPTSFTVNNTNTTYTIYGEAIGGTTSLSKQGSGTLYLNGANTFSGGVVIEGGTVYESGVTGTREAKLGTGKNGSWANQLTLRNGVFDLNNSENYWNASNANRKGWLSLQTLKLGGMAGGVMEIRNGVFGIGSSNPVLSYDATNDPGTATISASFDFTGTSSSAIKVFDIGDSSATETEVDFTGGLHVENYLDGGATTIEKQGAGTMQLSSGFGFPGLTLTEGTVRMNMEDAFVRGTVTLNGGTLDLNGNNQVLPVLAGSTGTITSTDPATVSISSGTSTYGGAVAGAVSFDVSSTLSLTGAVTTTGTLKVSCTGSLTLSAMPEKATIEVDCTGVPLLASGTWRPLTISGEVDESRITWKGIPEGASFITKTRDEETGTWTLTINRTEDNFILLPMGDSITEGYNSQEDAPSYRRSLANLMSADGMNPYFVGARTYRSTYIENENCRYHSGFSSQQVQTGPNSAGGACRGGFLQGAPNWLEQAGYPDAVTLMIGVNDSRDSESTEAEAQITAGTTFARWKALVKTMVDLRPNTWFIVATTTPANNRAQIVPYIQVYNALIKSLFTTTSTTIQVNGEDVSCVLGELNEEGKKVFGANAKVKLASMYDALPDSDNAAYYIDQLHPNEAGYDRMAAVWYEAIKTIKGANGGLSDAECIVDAFQTTGAMNAVTVVFNRQQRETSALTVTVNGSPATIASATLADKDRRVTLTLDTPLTDGAEVTIAKGSLSTTFTAQDKTVEGRVESTLRRGYVKVKSYTIPLYARLTASQLSTAFTTEAEASEVQQFDRLGYYVTLARPDGALRYLWVSMDRPDALATIDSLGFPTSTLRTKVSNLRVASNMPGVESVTTDGVEGLLQFSQNTTSGDAADTEHPVSLGTCFDWNTAFTSTYGYGAMQVFRLYDEDTGRADSGMPASTLFSYSRWAASSSTADEITLGDLANHNGNTTGFQTASITSIFTTSFSTLNTSAYTVRAIEIWVRPSVEIDVPEGSEEVADETRQTIVDAVRAISGGDAVTRVSEVSVVTQGGAKTSTDVADVNAACACFSGIADASIVSGEDATATVTLTYDFGIDGLKLAGDDVQITFRVRKGDEPADYADGVKFSVVTDEGTVLASDDATEASKLLTDVTPADAEEGVRVFTFPRPDTGISFRAKVTSP